MSGPQEPGVYVTTAAMYEEVRRVADGLIRLEGKLDRLIAADQDAGDRLDDHEERIRALERARWPLPALGAVTGVAGVAVGLFSLLR